MKATWGSHGTTTLFFKHLSGGQPQPIKTPPKKNTNHHSSRIARGTRVFVPISSVSCPFLDPILDADPGRTSKKGGSCIDKRQVM